MGPMDTVEQYLVDRGVKETVAKKLAEKTRLFPDLHSELVSTIENEAFPSQGVSVEGYTAKDIALLAPFMSYVGVYNFLGYLRNKPEEAKEQIKKGFPRR